MEHLVVVFHPLVDVVINVVFGHLADQGIKARAADNVKHFGVSVGPHHCVHIGQKFHPGVPRDLHGIGRNRVIQLILEHLGFIRFKGGDCKHVHCGCKGAANFFHLAGEIVFVGNFVVAVQLRDHRKAHGQRYPIHGVQGGRIFVVANDTGTDVGHGNVAVIVDNGNLNRVADGFKRAVAQVRVDNGICGVGLLNEEIQRAVFQRAGHIPVKFRIFHAPILQTGCDKGHN